MPEAVGYLHFGLVILPGLFDLFLGVLQQKERGDGSRQGRQKTCWHRKQHPTAEGFALLRPAPQGQGTSPPGLHPLLQSLPALAAALQPRGFAPSFSWPWAQAETLTGVLLQYVPKWVTRSLRALGTLLEGTHQAAVLQLPLQQAVQGEGDDVIQVLHLQKVEMGLPHGGPHLRVGRGARAPGPSQR